jgi:hypothetical protein
LQQVNWTQCAGLASFGIAGIAHLRTGRQNAGSDQLAKSWWLSLSALYGVLCIELIANTRHTFLRTIGTNTGLANYYDARRPGQVAMVLLLAIVITWLITKAIPVMRRRPGIGWALMLGLCSAGLFLTEVISLHQLDAIFYAKVGPVMLIGWAWLVLGFIAAVIAFASARPASCPVSH